MISKDLIQRMAGVLFCCCLLAGCGPDFDPEKEMEKAAAAVERKDYVEALGTIDKVAQAFPEYADVRYFYGLVLRRSGREADARLQFLLASRLDSTHAGALAQLGLMAFEVQDERLALEYLEKAAAAGLSQVRIHDTLAYLYRKFEQTDKARIQLGLADRLTPGNPRFRIKLAILEKETGNLRGAETILRPIARTYPDSWDAHLFLAGTLKELHELPEADSVLAMARRRNPRHPQLQYLLGSIRLGMGQPDTAEVAFRKAISLRSDLKEAHYGLAQALRRQGKVEESRGVLEQFRRSHEAYISEEEEGKTYITHWLQAVSHLKVGEDDAAVRALHEAMEIRSEDPAALTLLWMLRRKQGEQSEAEDIRGRIAAALKGGPLSEACRHVGVELLRRNQAEQAVAVLEAGVTESPADALLQYYLIRAYEQAGLPEQAGKQANKVMQAAIKLK